MASENDVEIRVRVDAEGALSVLDKTGKAISSVNIESQKASTGISRFQGSVIALNQGLSLIGRGISTVQSLGRAFESLVERGDAFNDLKQGFEAFGGTNSMLDSAREGVNGLATEMELLQVANKALLADIPGIEQNFGKLVAATTKIAESTGNDVVPSLERMTVALMTGSERALRSLRITIDEEAAEKKFAASIGTTADKLNDVGKTEAHRIAIQEQLLATAAKLPNAEKGVADALTTVKNAATDLITKIASEADNDPGLARALNEVAEQIKTADAGPIVAALKQIEWGAAALLPKIKAVGETILWITDPEVISKAWGLLGSTAPISTKPDVSFSWDETGQEAGAFAATLKNEVTPATNKQTEASNKLGKEVKTVNQYLKESKGIKLSAADEAYLKYLRESLNLTKSQADAILKEEQAFADYEASAKRAKEAGLAGAGTVIGPGASLSFTDDIKAAASALGFNISDEMAGSIVGNADAIIGDLARALNSSASKEGKFEAVGATIGAAIGSYFNSPQIGAALGGFIGKALTHAGESSRETIDAFRKLLGRAGVVGYAIDSALGDVVTKAFGGGRNDEQRARKALNKWWKELFKDTGDVRLMIENHVRKVRDLFEHETEKEIYNSGKGKGFGGIGDAFKALFGDEKLIGDQINNILAENVGNLNNLQLMLQAAKIDSEDFQAALEEAYLQGSMTAEEFLQASKSIEDVYAKGIPGATGATGQAFMNLQQGALQSGQIARDALIDMAAEAQELYGPGATMDQLRQSFLDQGMAVEEVDKIFQAFAQNGIDSLDKLLNINTTATANLVTSLEDLGFAFEKPTEELENMTKLVEDLKDAEVSVDVSLNISDEDRKALDQMEEFNGGSSGGANRSAGGWQPLGGGAGGGGVWSGAKIIAGTSDENWNSYSGGGSSGGGGYSGGGYSSSSEKEKVKRTVEDVLKDFAAGIINAAKAAAQMFKLDGDAKDVIDAFKHGAFNAAKANKLIGKLDKKEGTGFPGFGNVSGALKQMLKGGHKMKGFAGLRNIFSEGEEGGMSLGEVLDALEAQGYNAGPLRHQLASRDINTIEAAIRVDDSELLEILDIIQDGITIDVGTGKKTPGAGKKHRPGKKKRPGRVRRHAAL